MIDYVGSIFLRKSRIDAGFPRKIGIDLIGLTINIFLIFIRNNNHLNDNVKDCFCRFNNPGFHHFYLEINEECQ